MDQTLDNTPVPTDQVTIDTNVQPQLPTTEVAQTRAHKAVFGIGDVIQKGYDEIYQSIAQGNEDALRQEAATKMDISNAQAHSQQILDLAQQRGSQLSLDEVNSLQPPKPVDPKSVVEQGYATNYVNNIDNASSNIQDTVLDDAKAQDPKAVAAYMNLGTDLLSKREYAIKNAEEQQQAAHQQSWFGFTDPLINEHHEFSSYDLKQLFSFGFYSDLNLRGKTSDTGYFGFIGNVLDAEAKELLNQPFDDFKSKFDGIMGVLSSKEPLLAAQFAQAVAGMSTSEKFVNSASEAINAVLLGQGVRSGVGLFRRGPGGPTAPTGALNPSGGPNVPPSNGTLLQGSDSVYRAQKAVQDVIQSANIPSITKATIAEGAGDVQEAAVQKAVTSTLNPDPEKDALDTLLKLMRADITDLKTKYAPDLSREGHTRLIDAAESYEQKVVDVITDVTKVVRTPVAAEMGFRDISNRIVDYFPGRENTIANIDMRYDGITNTYHHDLSVTNYDGNPFSSVQLAERHAEANGYEPIIYGQQPDKIYFPAAALTRATTVDVFTTAKGSTYEVHDDGTTTRNKAIRPEHPGDSGSKQRSDLTQYLTAAQVTQYLNKKKPTGDIATEPEIGLSPFERWKTGPNKGKVHLGNEIVAHGTKVVNKPRNFELKETEGNARLFNDDGIEVDSSPTAIPGHIPYNLTTKKFEKPVPANAAVIEQKGLGFHIRVTVPLKETEDFIRDGLIGSPNARSSSNINTGKVSSIGNAVLGYIRSPDDTLSKVDVENRGKVVYTQSKFLELAHDQMREVEKVYKGLTYADENGQPLNAMVHHPIAILEGVTGKKKEVWNQFRRTLVALQKLPDPVTGLPGRYFTNVGDIHDFYMRTWRRPPTYQETAALLAISRLDHFDHILRNIAVYRNKSRVGVEQHTLFSPVDGKRTPIATFEGARIKDVRVLSTQDPVLIHSVDGTEKYFNSMGTKAQENFRKAVAEGRYRGVELYDMESMPIKRQDVEGNPLMIRYVFSNALASKPISYAQVGYRGGGHWEYNYDNGVKQAQIHRQWVGGKEQNIYKGDNTFAFVSNRAMGNDFVIHMNAIRELLAKRQYKDAKAYSAQHFDIEWKKMRQAFRPGKNPQTGELTPARFSLKEPFRVVPKGLTIRDLDDELEQRYTYKHPKTGAVRKTFIDGTKRGLARNFQVEYTQARDSYDLFAPRNTGTITQPFYKFEPAELTDPIVTMSRAMNRIVNSTYKDDYQIMAAEHWLQENKELLKASEAEIRSAPFRHFNEASNIGSYRLGADKLRVANAISNAYKIKQLIGTPSYTDTILQGIKQTVSDGLYTAGRDRAVEALDRFKQGKSLPVRAGTNIIKAPLVAPEWALDRVGKPVDFARAVAYHEYLGLGNWVQIVTQNMTYLSILAMSPTHAIQGTAAALLHQFSRLATKESHIDYLDRLATNFGWKLGEFKRGMELMDKTGFGITAKTRSIGLSNNNNEVFFRSWPKKALNAADMFFQMADQNVRFGAWFTAWHEFTEANPFLKIGPVEEGQILRRARDLNVNMDRSANTILNKGAFGMTMQFFDYLKKMGDLFWSKRLGATMTERNLTRLRMYIIFSLAFGPVGATGLSGLPFADQIRKKALEIGYVPGRSLPADLLMEGPLSVIGAFMTGKGDTQAGTHYNFNNRFGANGLQIIRDVMQTDPGFWKILMGASGSAIGNTISNLSGFTNAMYSMIQSDHAKEAWPLKEQDWLNGAKSIASARYAERLVYALQYGKWIDSHGRPTQDINAGEAVFRTLFGVQDVNIDDMYLKGLTRKDEKDIFNQGEQEYKEQRRLAEQAAANNDPQSADDYNKRAFFALTSRGVPKEMWPQIMARDAQMNRDTIETNNEGYYRYHVPTYRQDSAREADRAIQQMKAKQ